MFSTFVLASFVALQSPAEPAEPAEPAAVVADDAAALDSALASLVVAGGLTENEVAQLAADSSHDVEGKRAALDAADATLMGAGFAFIPKLAASAGYTRLSPIDAPVFGGGDSARFVVVQGAPGPLSR